MNILLAFKAEPDAGMLAEKEWQGGGQGNSGPGVCYCEVFSVLMNRLPPRCCWRREKTVRRCL
ncbi:putative electron transfer flavoprotein subunit ygcR [Escherichia coli 6-175-07_S1_C1]|nr:putative electron transfer flavoprotein subunit ygcR [Escherichia coli 6-175-07_S1_C1]